MHRKVNKEVASYVYVKNLNGTTYVYLNERPFQVS